MPSFPTRVISSQATRSNRLARNPVSYCPLAVIRQKDKTRVKRRQQWLPARLCPLANLPISYPSASKSLILSLSLSSGQGGLAFLGELESFTRLQIVLAPWPQGFPSGFRLPTLQAAPVSLNFPSEWVCALGLGLRVTGQRNPKEDAKETLIPT